MYVYTTDVHCLLFLPTTREAPSTDPPECMYTLRRPRRSRPNGDMIEGTKYCRRSNRFSVVLFQSLSVSSPHPARSQRPATGPAPPTPLRSDSRTGFSGHDGLSLAPGGQRRSPGRQCQAEQVKRHFRPADLDILQFHLTARQPASPTAPTVTTRGRFPSVIQAPKPHASAQHRNTHPTSHIQHLNLNLNLTSHIPRPAAKIPSIHETTHTAAPPPGRTRRAYLA